MTNKEAKEILEKHNHWRRCKDDFCECKMAKPWKLGEAIEKAIKALSIVVLVFLMASCASVKKKTDINRNTVNRDTVSIVKTDTVVRVDSTYKERYLSVLSQLEEKNDSVVVIKYKDRVITKKYGNTKELNSLKEDNERLVNRIEKIKSSYAARMQSNKQTVDEEIHTKTKKTTFWKKAALITWGFLALFFVVRFVWRVYLR